MFIAGSQTACESHTCRRTRSLPLPPLPLWVKSDALKGDFHGPLPGSDGALDSAATKSTFSFLITLAPINPAAHNVACTSGGVIFF